MRLVAHFALAPRFFYWHITSSLFRANNPGLEVLTDTASLQHAKSNPHHNEETSHIEDKRRRLKSQSKKKKKNKNDSDEEEEEESEEEKEDSKKVVTLKAVAGSSLSNLKFRIVDSEFNVVNNFRGHMTFTPAGRAKGKELQYNITKGRAVIADGDIVVPKRSGASLEFSVRCQELRNQSRTTFTVVACPGMSPWSIVKNREQKKHERYHSTQHTHKHTQTHTNTHKQHTTHNTTHNSIRQHTNTKHNNKSFLLQARRNRSKFCAMSRA